MRESIRTHIDKDLCEYLCEYLYDYLQTPVYEQILRTPLAHRASRAAACAPVAKCSLLKVFVKMCVKVLDPTTGSLRNTVRIGTNS